MFWTIVGAILFVVIVLPIIFNVVMSIINIAFESSRTLGCMALVVFFVIVMIIIF